MLHPEPLGVRVDAPSKTSMVFHVAGDLHGSKEGYALQEDIRRVIAEGAKLVVLDLAGIRRIDSCGFGILVASLVSATNAGAKLAVAGVPDRILAVLKAMNLAPLLVLAGSVGEALERAR